MSLHADIYCFQEFYDYSGSGIYNSVEKFRKKGFKYIVSEPYLVSKTDTIPHYAGNFIISRHPVIDRHSVKFPGKGNAQMICATIVYHTDTFEVINIHLASFHLNSVSQNKKSWFSNFKNTFCLQSKQMDSIILYLEQCRFPVILCGDFNATRLSPAFLRFYAALNSAYLTSGSGTGLTFPSKFPFLKIDHIFVSGNITVSSFKVKKNITFSDHLPVVIHIDE